MIHHAPPTQVRITDRKQQDPFWREAEAALWAQAPSHAIEGNDELP